MKRFALLGAAGLLLAGPASAQDAVPTIDTGDTAFILVSAALVMLMTPGLALFYGGMVRGKNVLGTLMHSFVALAIISVQWVLLGYALAFGADQGGFIGGLDWLGLRGVGAEPNADYAATIPHLAFMIYQCMFAVITPALITGAFAERMKFTAYLVFIVLWATLVYDPIAHWVWAVGGWLRGMGALDFAGGTVVHISSGVSALVAALVIGKRRGFPQSGDAAAQPDVDRARRRPPLVRLVRLQRRQRARRPAGWRTSAFVATNTAAAAATIAWMLDGLVRQGQADRARRRQRRGRRAGGDHAGGRLRHAARGDRDRRAGRRRLLRRGEHARQDRARRLARRLRRPRRRRRAGRAAHRRVRARRRSTRPAPTGCCTATPSSSASRRWRC